MTETGEAGMARRKGGKAVPEWPTANQVAQEAGMARKEGGKAAPAGDTSPAGNGAATGREAERRAMADALRSSMDAAALIDRVHGFRPERGPPCLLPGRVARGRPPPPRTPRPAHRRTPGR